MRDGSESGTAVWVQTGYASRYGLLGVMAEELCVALERRGVPVRRCPAEALPGPGDRGSFVFFNAPPSVEALPAAARSPGSHVTLVQVFVDHPLALPPGVIDALAPLPNYRLLTPCVDGLHTLRLRWPALRHGFLQHAVGDAALCPEADFTPGAFEGREASVAVCGSVHSAAACAEMLDGLPAPARAAAKACAAVMSADRGLGFFEAFDTVLGPAGAITGDWNVLRAVWRVTSTMVNRAWRTG